MGYEPGKGLGKEGQVLCVNHTSNDKRVNLFIFNVSSLYLVFFSNLYTSQTYQIISGISYNNAASSIYIQYNIYFWKNLFCVTSGCKRNM